jgi:hypothetical protein
MSDYLWNMLKILALTFSLKNNLEKCIFYFCKRGEFPDTKFDKETVYKDLQESIDSSHQRLNAVGGRKYYDNAAKPFLV